MDVHTPQKKQSPFVFVCEALATLVRNGAYLTVLVWGIVSLVGLPRRIAEDKIKIAEENRKKADEESAKGVEMSEHAQTSASQAEFTFTNRSRVPKHKCLRGVVTSITKGGGTGATILSFPVCSGEVPPNSSVTVQSPYAVGAVLDLCSSENKFGGKSLDWDKCRFDTVEATP